MREEWRSDGSLDLKTVTNGLILGIALFLDIQNENGEETTFKITPTKGFCCYYDDYTLRGIFERSRIER